MTRGNWLRGRSFICSEALQGEMQCDKGHRQSPFNSPHLPREQSSQLPGWMEKRRPQQAVMPASKGGAESVPPTTWLSHNAIKPLQATLLASHLAAKPQCLLHAVP
jgi:hypothetical protein